VLEEGNIIQMEQLNSYVCTYFQTPLCSTDENLVNIISLSIPHKLNSAFSTWWISLVVGVVGILPWV